MSFFGLVGWSCVSLGYLCAILDLVLLYYIVIQAPVCVCVSQIPTPATQRMVLMLQCTMIRVLTQLIQFTGSQRSSHCVLGSRFLIPVSRPRTGASVFFISPPASTNMKVGQCPIVTQISWQTRVHHDLMETNGYY